MSHDLEANKKNAIEFYRTAYLGDPEKAVELYVGAEYIQHNPLVADGPQPFINYFKRMAAEFPGKTIEFVRAVGRGRPSRASYASNLAGWRRIRDHGLLPVRR